MRHLGSLPLVALLVAAALTSLTVIAGNAAPPAPAAAESAERARLVGLWKGYTVEGKGENPNAGPVKLELTITERVIKGIQVTPEKRVDQGEGEYTLDLSAAPCHLDATKTNARGRKEVFLGIYALEGDTLKWCVGPKDRPKTFETIKGQYLLILKRGVSR